MRVRIPTPLFSYTENRALVEARGATLDELTHDLDRQFPGIRFRFVDEQDHIRFYMKIFVNGKQVLDLRAPLRETDEIFIIQALSGGLSNV